MREACGGKSAIASKDQVLCGVHFFVLLRIGEPYCIIRPVDMIAAVVEVDVYAVFRQDP